MKKMILILMVAFHLATVSGVAISPAPIPDCYPCDDADDDTKNGG